MRCDYLVVGAGLAGAVVAERLASQLKKKILVVESRDHVAGNCYCYRDNNGIMIHKYGPHIFRTSSKRVWDYLSLFTEWHSYEHRVLAKVDSKLVPLPFNFSSIKINFSKADSIDIISRLRKYYPLGADVAIWDLLKVGDPMIRELADFVLNKIYLGYTKKQWGMNLDKLDRSVVSGVPLRMTFDNRYFNLKYQALPKKGYTVMVENMLDNKNIELQLRTRFEEVRNSVLFDYLVYTGPIDEYFQNCYGPLPYRSVRFDMRELSQDRFQPVAQVNYPNEWEYTRVTEFKHFFDDKSMRTTISYEYPQNFEPGSNEPYYPIPTKENHQLYRIYRALARKEKNTYFVGRLAEYKYYNMEQTVLSALNLFDDISKDK